MKRYNLFPTPVMEFDYSDHPDIQKLLNFINQSDIPPHGLIEQGFSSRPNINILLLPEFINLKNDIQKSIDYYSKEINIIHSYIYQSWFNILNNKGKVSPHHHGASILSGAFYPLLEENSCNLIFKTPLYSSLNFRPINYESTDDNHFLTKYEMPIKQNHLYVFPGWLEHYTEENKSKKRIVVSFNTMAYY